MALTKVSRGLLSTGIVDNSNATAITPNADESATFSGGGDVTGTATMGGLTVDGNDSYTSNIKFDYGASAPTYFANWGYKSSSDGNKVFLTITDGGAAKDVLVANYNGNVGIGVSSPQRTLVLGKGDSTGVQTQYTNSTTGAALGDGFTVGIDGSENAEFWNFENTNMLFATNSSERMRITSAGALELTGPGGAGETFLNFTADSNTLKAQISGAKEGANGGTLSFSTNNSSGTLTPTMLIDSAGRATMPYQPAFAVRPASQQDNISVGANTTVVFGTEIFDRGSNFASNTFTAPVTGLYQLNVTVYFFAVQEAMEYIQINLQTSNNVNYAVISPSAYENNAPYLTISHSVLADMDASDTAFVQVQMGNGGLASTDITVNTQFSGYLVA